MRKVVKYLVQEIENDFETSKDRVFIDYGLAVNYFKQLLGEFLLDGFMDSDETVSGGRDLRNYFEIFKNLYFETGKNETITHLPASADDFKTKCDGNVAFGDFDIFVIRIKLIEEIV